MKNFNSLSEPMKIALIGAAATILAAIIVGIFQLRSISSNQSSASPTAPPVPITSATTQSTNLATTSTPTSQVILINQTSSCTNCLGGTNFSLIVKNATIDPANSQVTLLIGIRNNSTITISPYISFLKLQNTQTGVSVDGGGDGFGTIFTITANQVILFRPTFQFVPAVGNEYSLSAELSSQYDFSPIPIKF